jgi:hypothetical protein
LKAISDILPDTFGEKSFDKTRIFPADHMRVCGGIDLREPLMEESLKKRMGSGILTVKNVRIQLSQ